jgi:DNA-binding NarL/FixJ family response regulator
MSVEPTIRVLVVEDHRLTREGLRLMLDASPGTACLAAVDSVEAALRWHGHGGPDVVLLDVQLPGMPGSEGVRPLRERWPQAAVLMHTVFDEDEAIFESLCNGAIGYVLKRTTPARLLETVREAHDGGAPMTPEIARRVVTLFRRVTPLAREAPVLAPQEIRLLALLAEGASYESAAASLGLSINTVRTYVRRVYEKLHVRTRSAAVGKAMRAGLI